MFPHNRILFRRMQDVFDRKDAGGGGDAGNRTAPEIKTLEDLKSAFLENHKELKTALEKAMREVEATGNASTETKNALRELTEKLNTIGGRIDKVEEKAGRLADAGTRNTEKSLGELFVELPAYKDMSLTVQKNIHHTRLDVKGFDFEAMVRKAIINATGQNQPLVPDQRVPGIITTPNRRLRIRQLLPRGQTTSNLVQFVRENVFTNNAGPQAGASPTTAGENQLKNESDITFTLANAPVVTIAHFILASTQVLDDAPMLQSYINSRLLYGLELEEEEELLTGDGTVGTLDGLMNQATAYNRAQTGTRIDWLRRAITQLQLSEYDAEFIVLNPADWENIELTKDVDGRYIIANPQSLLGPQLWGLPIVATNTMPATQFLMANGSQAAQIWDRMQSAVLLSREDSDNFRRNMVTLLAEERLALTVYRTTALINGVFTV